MFSTTDEMRTLGRDGGAFWSESGRSLDSWFSLCCTIWFSLLLWLLLWFSFGFKSLSKSEKLFALALGAGWGGLCAWLGSTLFRLFKFKNSDLAGVGSKSLLLLLNISFLDAGLSSSWLFLDEFDSGSCLFGLSLSCCCCCLYFENKIYFILRFKKKEKKKEALFYFCLVLSKNSMIFFLMNGSRRILLTLGLFLGSEFSMDSIKLISSL